jgi:hypothetical protein
MNFGTRDIGIVGQNFSWIQAQYNNLANTTQLLCLNPIGGNVGIGNTAPTVALDINGILNVFDTTKTFSAGLGTEVNAQLINYGINSSRLGTSNTSGHGGFFRLDSRQLQAPIQIYYKPYGSTVETMAAAIGSTGNFGISTSSPSTNLHVVGSALFTSTITSGAHLVTGGGLLATFNSNTVGNIFTTGGNVGIATTSPAFTLDVSGTARITGSLTTGNVNITNGTLVINSSMGNVSPFTPISVVNTNQTGIAGINFSNILQNSYIGVGGTSYANANNANNLFLQSSTNIIMTANNVGGTPNLYISSSGNVGIGTSTPGFTLDISGTTRITSSLLAIGNSNTLGNIYTTGGNVGIATVTPSIYADLTINGGNQAITSTSQANIAFSYLGAWYHFINSRHSAIASQNAIDFYVNNNAGATGSSAPNFGNVNSMSVTATGVGIFSSNPGFSLDVTGTGRFTSSLTSGSHFVTYTSNQRTLTVGPSNNSSQGNIGINGTGQARYHLYNGGAVTEWLFGQKSSSNNSFILSTLIGVSENDILTVTSMGNIGINTSTPVFSLDVTGTGRFTSSITTGAHLITAGGLVATFNNNTLGNLYTTGGNVGINMTTPRYSLDINGTILCRNGNISTNTNGNQILFGYGGFNAYMHAIKSRHSSSTNDWGNALDFSLWQTTDNGSSVGSKIVMSVTSSGVGINQTGPVTSFDLNGQQYFSNTGSVSPPTMSVLGGTGAKLTLYPGTDGTTLPYAIGVQSANTWYTSPFGHMWYTGTTSPSMQLTNGNLIVTGDVIMFGSISDQRLKTNVQNINSSTSIDKVNSLRPVTFNWKDDIFNKEHAGKSDSGFIAQEIEQVIGHAVAEYPDLHSGNIYKNIKYERIIPYLTSAIQELSTKLNEALDRITVLERNF